MNWLRALCIAFSIYSRIPVPVFDWKDEDMRHQLVFFPLVGAVIGGLIFGWQRLCAACDIGGICYVAVGCIIPLIVTGGFHVDGFMDTADAFRSYRSREDKLKIMKDPHIGAFAVISLIILAGIFAGAFAEINEAVLPVFAASFFLSRTFSALAVLIMPPAKKDGMMNAFSDAANGAGKRTNMIIIIIEAVLCSALMIVLNWLSGLAIIAACCAAFGCYYLKCRKELGGITGDTAGYFVCICETAAAVAAAVISLIMKGGIL